MSGEDSQLFVALYTDEDVTRVLAELLRQRGYDAISAHEVGLIGVPDEAHLTFAAAQNRAVLTYNRDDFLTLSRQWYVQGRDHAGIIISQQFRQRAIGELLRQTLNLMNAVVASEMRNTVRFLQSYR